MTNHHDPRTPRWVQDTSTKTLHGIAGHLRRERIRTGLSDAQEWLWDRIVPELERRNKRLPIDLRCYCDLCLDPVHGEPLTFDELLDETYEANLTDAVVGALDVWEVLEDEPF